jgi:hypothetical protein
MRQMRQMCRVRQVGVALAVAALSGAATVATASAAQAVTPPATRTVNVQVVPALAGVAFTLNGIAGVTGPGGTDAVVDPNLNGAASGLVVPNQTLTPSVRISLDRVANDPNHGAFTRKLVAELDEDRAVSISMLTPQKKVLPLDEVTSVAITSSLGSTTQFTGAQLAKPVWLAASRPALTSSGASGRLVTYAFKSVIIHGANVVNSGQLHFTPNKASIWQVPVILHSLTILANDLLAGRPAGKTVQLTYPDGSKVTVPLGAEHEYTFVNLPRGSYKVKVGGGLIALASTVRLSRNQTATEVVVTEADAGELALMLFSVTAVVVAAGVIGRRLRRQTGRKEGTSHALLT